MAHCQSPMAPPSRLALSSQYKRIIPEADGTIRKYGNSFGIERETSAITFIRKHTTIPVPEILDFQVIPDNSWILMKQSPGVQIDSAWPTMTPSAQLEMTTQLASYLRQLRDIDPPSHGWIGSCSGGPAYDHRLNNGFQVGPFGSVSEFHDFLVEPVKKCPRPELATKYRGQLSDDYRVYFAHADISYENILVDEKTGDITAILDWEMAGFWPEWWEYRKALYGDRHQKWWYDVVNQVLPCYYTEFEIDDDLEMFG